MNLTKLPSRNDDGDLHVVVESPRGSGLKLKYEPKLGVFLFHRPLPLGLTYPYEWGFIPSTEGDDGDPLDAMVVSDVPSYPGTVIECAPIAVVQVEQDKKSGKGRERNDRLIAVPKKMPRLSRELTARQREEIEAFFLAVVAFEDKQAKIIGWKGPKAAEKMVADGAA